MASSSRLTTVLAMLLLLLLSCTTASGTLATGRRLLKGKICWFPWTNCNPPPNPPPTTYPKVTTQAFNQSPVSSSTSSGNTLNAKAFTTVLDAKTFAVTVQITSASVNGQPFSLASSVGALGALDQQHVSLEQQPLVLNAADTGYFASVAGTYTVSDVSTACILMQLTQIGTTSTAIFSTCNPSAL